jgi:ABC-2 type transport system ATP-binding protein
MKRKLNPEEIAVSVRNVHKDFIIPHTKNDSIKHKIITAFQPKSKGSTVAHVLDGISFDIKKGEFYGVVGRNGSGKSTLLKIISDIYRPTSGKITHNGRIVAFIELGVGFNTQLSGKDNVYLNGAMLGFSRSEIDAMYEDIVSFAELEEFMDLDLRNYSSGMRVRLAFSIAVRAEADILVLDEVLAVGDKAFKQKCYDYFQNLKDRKKTIIFVTHSMGQVKEYCDRAIVIEKGKIIYEGGAEEVAKQYDNLFKKK